MRGKRTRIVSRSSSGGWGQGRSGAKRAGSRHRTQAAAVRQARRTLRREGGGELIIRGTNGRFRAKDTIAPARDPRSSRG